VCTSILCRQLEKNGVSKTVVCDVRLSLITLLCRLKAVCSSFQPAVASLCPLTALLNRWLICCAYAASAKTAWMHNNCVVICNHVNSSLHAIVSWLVEAVYTTCLYTSAVHYTTACLKQAAIRGLDCRCSRRHLLPGQDRPVPRRSMRLHQVCTVLQWGYIPDSMWLRPSVE